MSQEKKAKFWGKFWGTLILSVGVLLLLQTLGFITWEVWDFVGPGLLIVWGGTILLKAGIFSWVRLLGALQIPRRNKDITWGF